MRVEIDPNDDNEKGRIVSQAASCIHGAESQLRNFPGLLKQIIWSKAWERRLSKGKVFELSSLRELITEKPLRGWGEDVRTVENVIRDDPECLAMFREAMKLENQHDKPKQNERTNNGSKHRNTIQGNTKAYSIDRVKRACEPEIVAKVMSGEMSPNAALVKAGIRENRQVYIPREPAKAVEKLRELFGMEFVDAIVKHAQALTETGD